MLCYAESFVTRNAALRVQSAALFFFKGKTSLIWASSKGHFPVAELLIGAKADVNAHNVSRMWTVLFINEFRFWQYALNSPP